MRLWSEHTKAAKRLDDLIGKGRLLYAYQPSPNGGYLYFAVAAWELKIFLSHLGKLEGIATVPKDKKERVERYPRLYHIDERVEAIRLAKIVPIIRFEDQPDILTYCAWHRLYLDYLQQEYMVSSLSAEHYPKGSRLLAMNESRLAQESRIAHQMRVRYFQIAMASGTCEAYREIKAIHAARKKDKK